MTIDEIFKDKSPNFQKLKAFGFKQNGDEFEYTTSIARNQLVMTVTIIADKTVKTKVTDPAADSEYVLHRDQTLAGAFIGMVRTDHDSLLCKIAQNCFDMCAFRSVQALQLIGYVHHTHGDLLEFLWKSSPQSAVWRRKDTGKWYGVMMAVPGRRLGLDFDEKAEILDLRAADMDIDALLDSARFLPGYHMSKKHWYTVCLDGSVPTEEICRLIDKSYDFAVK